MNKRFTPVTHENMRAAAPGQLTAEQLGYRRLDLALEGTYARACVSVLLLTYIFDILLQFVNTDILLLVCYRVLQYFVPLNASTNIPTNHLPINLNHNPLTITPTATGATPRNFFLFGNPISQSLSPRMHNRYVFK